MRYFAVLFVCAFAMHAQSPEPPPVKVGVIEWQKAIMSTQEGQRRAAALQAQFEPRRAQVEGKRAEIEAWQDRLRRGVAAMDEAARSKIERDIDRGTRLLNRMVEDLNLDIQEEQANVARELGANMNAVIQKFIERHGFAVVLEVTKGEAPAAWSAASADITADVVKAYDLAHPVRRASTN
jgi:outer membrane protein